jgi:hypothetical protein
MNKRKAKQVDDVFDIIRMHQCESCTSDYKKHLLVYWHDLINDTLPCTQRLSMKCLARAFKMLKPRGVYHEPFLLGKKKAQIHDNYYIYIGGKR